MTTSGFYRFSDIMWEWPKYEDGKHESALKALFNPTGLTDAGSPLRLPGADGIELYLGEFPNRHKVLLFTSHQIEYARYFLQTTGVVRPNETIKLPSWEYLHPVENFLQRPTPCLFSTPGEIKDIVRQLDKHKRKVKQGGAGPPIKIRQSSGGKATAGSQPGASAPKALSRMPQAVWKAKDALERTRNAWRLMKETGRGAFLAIDFETHEVQQQIVLEWGWAGSCADTNELKDECGHYLARDHLLTLANGKYVPDNRKRYRFGETEVAGAYEFDAQLRELIETWHARAEASGGPLYLVFHDATGDLKTLSRIGMPDLPIRDALPVSVDLGKAGDVHFVDTQVLYDAVIKLGGSDERSRSLATMTQQLGLQPKATFFHNAGNDAHYTLDCLKLMMEPEVKLAWIKTPEDESLLDSDDEPGGML